LADQPGIALVGGDSLLGREVRDLAATQDPPVALKLIAGEDEEAGTITEQAGEPALVTGLAGENLTGAPAVILAATPDLTRQVLGMDLQGALVDLTYAGEDDARARLRAPMVEPAGFQAATRVHVIAHPAAIALALLFNPLHIRHRLRAAIAHIFEPASERGPKGLDELQQQTVSLLSFKPLPKAVYDAQAAFNLLAAWGEEAPGSLQDIELRIERHLATLLANSSRAPMPSLRLVQAPVFHGYTVSLWVDFEENPGVEALQRTLTGAGIDVRDESLEPPTNVGIAGQSGIAVGAIAMDRNHPTAVWIWLVADNLRLAAENALQVAREAA
jgi:aspartate-semialdehyde dehydrogenase